MVRTSQWQPTAAAPSNEGDHPTLQAPAIKALQRLLDEAPCFATDKRHDCAEPCKWRRNCRGMVAAWLR